MYINFVGFLQNILKLNVSAPMQAFESTVLVSAELMLGVSAIANHLSKKLG